ncbi:MAG: phosphoadenylyl-sulfate reductase [Chitinophagales bacterium]|nr:MAG: phosphoadenylyl-sulfate reductase [Chitinophagales bacterium]
MKYSLDQLNATYQPLTPLMRLQRFYQDFGKEKVLVTSSFGTSSVYLLSLISTVNKSQKIHFINTRFLFKETLEYKNHLARLLELEVVDVEPNPLDHDFTQRNATWNTDPDFCCMINKVEPLNKIKPQYNVWVTGLLAFQNSHRKSMKLFEFNGMLKFNPIIDVSEQEVERYIRTHNLPRHPLLAQGYGSVGCVHCTVKGAGRSGRWAGKSKTECGLHLPPFSKSNVKLSA